MTSFQKINLNLPTFIETTTQKEHNQIDLEPYFRPIWQPSITQDHTRSLRPSFVQKLHSKIDFCTPIILHKNELPKSIRFKALLLLSPADKYLSFSSHEAHIKNGKINHLKIKGYVWKTALKIISFVVTFLFLPSLLIAKLIYREFCKKYISTINFSSQELNPPNHILTNQLSSSNVIENGSVSAKKNDEVTSLDRNQPFSESSAEKELVNENSNPTLDKSFLTQSHGPAGTEKAPISSFPTEQENKTINTEDETSSEPIPILIEQNDEGITLTTSQSVVPADSNDGTHDETIPPPPPLPQNVAQVTNTNHSGIVESAYPKMCPINYTPLQNPVILLEDGFIYEKEAIETWLRQNPNRSPFLGPLTSATLCKTFDNLNKEPVCPLTKKPFVEPYFCVEEKRTFEKTALEEWIKDEAEELIRTEKFLPPYIFRSPRLGVKTKSLTLYPNKILFSQDKPIPATQTPIHINFNSFIKEENLPKKLNKCIYDLTVRNLIINLFQENDYPKRNEIKGKIIQRRTELGLTSRDFEGSYYFDMSNLDLSNMNLVHVNWKGCNIKETSFKNSSISTDCFCTATFLYCDFENVSFSEKILDHRPLSFYKCNFKNAKFDVMTQEFFDELENQKALNLDSIQVAGTHLNNFFLNAY